MANKNEVTLTFAGDSRSLDRTVDKVGQGTRQLEQDFDRAGAGARRLDSVIGQGGRSFGDYGRGLGGVGDRADEVDTRMMGLSDGIQGVTDLMGGNGKLRPHEMAMAFSDLGSAAYNTVIPSLQDVTGKTKNMVTGFKEGTGAGGFLARNMGTIAIGAAGAAAAIALVTMTIMDNKRRAQEARQAQEDWGASIRQADGDMRSASLAMVENNDRYDDLRGLLSQTGTPMEEFVDRVANGTVNLRQMAEASDLSRGETFALITAVGQYTNDQEQAAEATEHQTRSLNESISALTDYGEALRAQYDPLFGMMDAQRENAEAQATLQAAQLELTAAIRDHGRGSDEARQAQEALTDAEFAAREAVVGLEGAATDLRVAIDRGQVSAGDARRQFVQMATTMGYSKGEAQRLASQFGLTTREAQRLGGQRPRVRVQADTQNAFNQLWGVKRAVDQIPSYKRVTIEQAFNKLFSGGGIVYAADGFAGAARGTDTVPAMLTPGEMVLNDAQQAELWAMANGRGGGGGGGGPIVNLYVQGSIRSDRDMVDLIRDAMRRGEFDKVLRR